MNSSQAMRGMRLSILSDVGAYIMHLSLIKLGFILRYFEFHL